MDERMGSKKAVDGWNMRYERRIKRQGMDEELGIETWRIGRQEDSGQRNGSKMKTALIPLHLPCKQPLSLGERAEPQGREGEKERERQDSTA